ncbi:MAG: Hpt domain-containing protein [Pseudomonadota bacterium]
MLVSPGLAVDMVDEVSSSALPSASEPIDLGHLSRMTLGERSLEREVLALFDRQADILLNRMTSVAPSGVATLAHTLKGSAVGIGAWGVARAAEAVEKAGPAALAGAIAALGAAIADAKQAIAGLLRAH